VSLAVGEARIDVGRHTQHIARNVLFRVVIAGEIALDVTIRALDAKRGSESAHRLLNIHIGRQNLQVLRWSGRWACFRAASAPLGKQADRTNEEQAEEYAHAAHPIPLALACQICLVCIRYRDADQAR
jgi:hypothetical protein